MGIYGFFYIAYQNKYYYYDFLILVKKFAIHVINVIFADEIESANAIFPILISNIILFLFGAFQFYYKPFN